MRMALGNQALIALALSLAVGACGAVATENPAPPHVLLIMTDDQGYSDVGYNGNPLLKTPRIDALAQSGVVFDQFYAQPVCSPTRAALMTGRHAMRLGVMDTQNGNAILPTQEVTIAEALRDSGYVTGLFGKWHLGDNAPARPQDQGFDRVLTHVGGMIGMPYNPPHGRSYFDPVLIENGQEREFAGYAPDVFTDQAITFMADAVKAESRPFFAVLSFNTPHHPLTVSDAFAGPYRDQGLSEETSRYYGMITNIDYNIGRAIDALDALEVLDDTLVIFVGDNGTSSLHQQPDLWERGLRGRKTHVYENGIRVPMIVKAPAPAQSQGVRSDPAIVQDIMPTILDLAGVNAPVAFDGVSLASAVRSADAELPERDQFFQFHRGSTPERYRNIAVRRGDLKLVQPVGRGAEPFSEELARFELYDLSTDPFESRNIAHEQPETVAELITAYDRWLADTRSGTLEPQPTWIGDPSQNPVTLSRQDWIGGGLFDGDNGHYELFVRTPGRYKMTFRWSRLLNDPHDVTIQLNDQVIRRQILASEMEARIEDIALSEGPLRLQAWVTIDGQDNGFEFVEIERLSD